MAVEAQIKNRSSSMKEFESLLNEDFKDRKLQENQIIKATVTEITKKNWQTTAVCHVDHIGVIYAYITKYKNNNNARFDVRVFRGYSKSAKEFKDSFDNLGDAIEAVNARKGKMAQTLMLPAHLSQYPPERGADIEIFGINTKRPFRKRHYKGRRTLS